MFMSFGSTFVLFGPQRIFPWNSMKVKCMQCFSHSRCIFFGSFRVAYKGCEDIFEILVISFCISLSGHGQNLVEQSESCFRCTWRLFLSVNLFYNFRRALWSAKDSQVVNCLNKLTPWWISNDWYLIGVQSHYKRFFNCVIYWIIIALAVGTVSQMVECLFKYVWKRQHFQLKHVFLSSTFKSNSKLFSEWDLLLVAKDVRSRVYNRKGSSMAYVNGFVAL